MTQSALTADQARHELYEIMQADIPFDEKAARALDLGETYLGVDNGHLTKIDPDANYWETIASTDSPDGEFPSGLVLDLNTTYCRRVLEADDSIALHDAPAQGWADDPAFDAHELHCYHGTPLHVDGEPWGTVCFVSETPREMPFDDDDTLFAELIARLLEHELEYAQHRGELTRRSNLITVLSRVLRHNLRNDMTVVRGRLRLLMDRDDDAAAVGQPALNRIDNLIKLSETARRLESIISTEFERQQCDLMTLLEQVVADVTADFPAATISLDGPESVPVSLKSSLQSAFTELIENAVKHTQDPTVSITVEVTSEGIEIHVRDTGPGLPEQEQKVLDEGTETPLAHGSGLGLWTVYWIVTDHDGRIETDVTTEGTRVTVTLPEGTTGPDVMDNAAVERQIQREQDRFEAVFRNAFDAILIADDEGRYLDANESAGELFGLPPAELLGRSISEFAADDFDFEAAWEAFQESGPQQGIFPLVQPDGTERTVEYAATANITPGQHLTVMRDITERVERDRELTETTERLEAIIEASPDAIIVLDSDGAIQVWNDAAETVFGYPESEVLGKSIQELNLHDADEVGVFEERFRRALAGESVTGLEVTRQTRDGDPVRLSISTAPIRDTTGTTTGVVGVVKDISDQIREQQFVKSLLESLPDPVYAFDTDGQLIRWNEEFEAVTGFSSDEIEEMHVTEFVPDSETETIATNFQTILEERRQVTVEAAFETKSGERIPYEFTGGPLTNSDGSLRGVTGVGRDLTERKKYEHESEQRTEFLQDLYDVATDAESSVEETITRLLTLGTEKLGLPYGHVTRIETEANNPNNGTQIVVEATGDHDLLQPGDSSPLSQSYCRHTIETGDLYEVHDASDAGWAGDPAYERFNLGCYIGTPITVNDELYGTLFFAAEKPRDQQFSEAERMFVRLMGKLVSYELERNEILGVLTQQNERLAQFTSIVSHDLRNPLNVAQGHLELAQEEVENEHLGHVAHAHKRMEALIDDLLTLAREGEPVSDTEQVELASLVAECWDTVATEEAELVIDVDRVVQANASRLKQVFENLLRNAIEHGGSDVTITVGDLPDGFYIADDGSGIPPEKRDAVLDRGYSTAEGGTGFGLSIVQQITDAHGWDLEIVESTTGGARIEITGVDRCSTAE